MKLEIEDWTTFIVSTLGAFGGWAVVVAGLTHYIGEIFASRTLQREGAKFSEQLEGLSHELRLRESSYSKHLDLLLDYYSTFYRHYRLCQNAAKQDAHRMPDGSVVRTKDTFLAQLDDYLGEIKKQEGRARLVLPGDLLKLDGDAIDAFNAFKDVMLREQYDDVFHERKREAFAQIHSIKEQLESGLRDLLRTEKLLVDRR